MLTFLLLIIVLCLVEVQEIWILNQCTFYCNLENHHARTKAVVTLQQKVMTHGTASVLGISNVINHPFSMTVSTYLEWFHCAWLPHGWQLAFPHSSAIVHNTHSLVKLHLSLSEVVCFCASWNETLLMSHDVLYASVNCLYIIKNELPCFLRLIYILITTTSEVPRTKQVFDIEQVSWSCWELYWPHLPYMLRLPFTYILKHCTNLAVRHWCSNLKHDSYPCFPCH